MLEHLKRLIKGSVIYGIGSFLNKFISLLLLPLFTSYLTPEDYGVVAVLALLSFFFAQIFTLGIGVSLGICYFEQGRAGERNQVITSAFIVLVASSLIMLFLGNVLVKPINHFLFPSGNYQSLIVITLFSAAFSILVTPFILKLQFEERQIAFILITFISTVISIGASVVLIVFLKRGAYGMVEAMAIAQIFTFLLFVLYAVREIRFKINLKLSKELIRFGLPMVPSFFALYVLQQGNVYTLSHTLGSLEAVGLYSIASSFASVMLLIVSAFSTAWFPFYMSFVHKQEEAKLLFGHIMKYYIFGLGLISLLFYIFAKPLVMVFTQPAFYDAYKVIGLIATGYFLIGIFNILLPPIYFAKEVKYVMVSQLIAAILFIGMSFLMVNALGIIGAGISLIFGYGAMAALTHLWNQCRKRYLNIRYEWGRIALFGAMFIFSAIFILWEKNINFFTEFMLSVLLFIVFISGIYFLLYRWEREALLNVLKLKLAWCGRKIKLKF